jgi:O-antigen/teichoic acid export membrane protein
MQRFFFRNLLFLISVNLLIKPLWIFGIDRSVQNVVGSESYGIYFIITNLSLLTQILLDLGISHYNNRLIAQQEHLLSRQLSQVLTVKLILSGLYLLITLGAALLLRYEGHVLFLLMLVCVNQMLASLITYVRSNISALHRFVADSMLSVMDKSLMILACGFLLTVPVFRSNFIIDWFIYAQLGAYAITLAAALIYVLRITGKISLGFSLSFSRDLLRNTFPFALLIALMMIYGRIDGVMIEKLLPVEGEREAGLYASAFRLVDAFNQFGFLFSMLLLPIFSRMIGQKKNVEHLAVSGFKVIHICAVTAVAGTWFYSSEIMHLLYNEASAYSSHILRILMLTIIGSTTTYIFSTLLTANNNLRQLIWIAAVAALINYLLNRLLIPAEKAWGSAAAAAITQIGIGAAHLILSAIVFRFRLNTALMGKLILYAIASSVLFFSLKQLPLNWILTFMTGTAICLLLAFALRLLDVKKVAALVVRNREETVN